MLNEWALLLRNIITLCAQEQKVKLQSIVVICIKKREEEHQWMLDLYKHSAD